MLSCNFSGLPIELFYHMGLGKSNLVPFQACLRANSHNDPRNCRSGHIRQCSGNSKAVYTNHCPENIKNARNAVYANSTNTTKIPTSFLSFAKCTNKFQKRVNSCITYLENKCQASRMVTYKGLRVTMRSVERMLEMDPDLHVVYYVRDPRGYSYITSENFPYISWH